MNYISRRRMSALLVSAVSLATLPAFAQEPPPERPERLDAANPPEQVATRLPVSRARRLLPGVQPGGEVLLPNQWSIRPTGNQLELGDFPVNLALHPTQPFAAILHAGHGTHEVMIVSTTSRQIVSRIALPQTFYGLAFSADGTRLFASGAEEEIVHSFAFGDGLLSDHRRITVVDQKSPFVVTGVTPRKDATQLYVCGGWGGQLAIVDTAAGSPSPRIIDIGKDTYPYAALPSPDGTLLYVSLWGASAVAIVDIASGSVRERWATPSHPTELVLSPDGHTLYVACANSTQVAALDTSIGRPREIINCALYPNVPSGNTPNSLALSADGSILAVANADNNNLAIFNVSTPGTSRSMGFIPTGWYPTAVRFKPDGGIIYTSGKGVSPKANRFGPNPLQSTPGGIREYIGGLFRGTLGFVQPLTPEALSSYTKAAFEASPLLDGAAARTKQRDADNPIPARVGDPSPIKHCVYIIKENRTYDQVFGEIPEGNGDPNLCIFPERVTPNHHALAREFVLLDNFYVESEVSADGHEWSMGAYASDFVEKTWPLTYRGWRPQTRKLAYPSEGSFDIAVPAGGYLWDRCIEAGVTYRTYGEWIENGKNVGDPGRAKVPALEGRFDPMFRGYDLDYPDVKRAERYLEELARFEREGEMPRMTVIRIGNDHTAGTRRGKLTPTAMVADNDLALGMIVQGLSKSRFWPTTAVFVIEDDAQNGSDHVDAHRTIALVVSPYTKRRHVDSSMYSTASMLRTMELILGLAPMSQFDAAALPMYASFTPTPDTRPYTLRPARVDLNEKNAPTAWGADLSESFDLSKEDAADDLLLNEVIWRSVKGAESPMPPPVRAAFVFAEAEEEGE